MNERAIVELENVSCWFRTRSLLHGPISPVRAVDGVSLHVQPSEVVGLVGESGSGKTTTARLILRLVQPTGGSVRFRGNDLPSLAGAGLKAYRRAVQAVFQDPFSSFNPRMRIRDVVSEPLLVRGTPRATAYARATEVLQEVGLGSEALPLFPHEFSGGQRQRIAIARALSCSPELIVLDEPVASLDVSIRGQVINLLSDLRRELHLSYLLISHDLATTRYLSDRIYVMYAGRIVEHAAADPLYRQPLHPYTKALLSTVAPQHDADDTPLILQGEPPDPRRPPSGCRFHPRCPAAMAGCVTVEPETVLRDGHSVACHLYTNQLSAAQREPLRRDEPDERPAAPAAAGMQQAGRQQTEE